MCQFGDSSKIIKEYTLEEKDAIIGYRKNIVINPFNDKEKVLKSTNMDYLWPKKALAEGKPTKDNSEGIYSYNYNNYYNHYNYSYDYSYYNNNNYYYNNNYNNNNYNHYNNYYNHYNNYYNLFVLIKIHGQIFEYKEGYRSQFAKPYQLVILHKDSKWFTDSNTIKFATHFNSTIESLAKEYDCEVIEWGKVK
jgi:hypothetical protein